MTAALATPAVAAVLAVVAVIAAGVRGADPRRPRRADGVRAAERLAPRRPANPRPRRRPDRRLDQRLVTAACVLAAFVVAPPAAPIVAALAVVVPMARQRRRARRRERQLRRELPEVADLLAVAVDAGLTVGEGLSLVSAHMTGALAGELRLVEREVAVGRRLGDALDALGERIGEGARPFAVVLADSERSGGEAGPSLRQLAHDGRDWRRRDAEEAARRLPVQLLFPLVGCVLPAFALLTVVPVVAGALRALRP